jgi:hypothetical protein
LGITEKLNHTGIHEHEFVVWVCLLDFALPAKKAVNAV